MAGGGLQLILKGGHAIPEPGAALVFEKGAKLAWCERRREKGAFFGGEV